jgi:hypothetical protein
MMFDFGTWKQRDIPCVLTGAKVAETQEALEETMMNLNTMNVRHSEREKGRSFPPKKTGKDMKFHKRLSKDTRILI